MVCICGGNLEMSSKEKFYAESSVEEQAGAVRDLKEGKGLGNDDPAVKVS